MKWERRSEHVGIASRFVVIRLDDQVAVDLVVYAQRLIAGLGHLKIEHGLRCDYLGRCAQVPIERAALDALWSEHGQQPWTEEFWRALEALGNGLRKPAKEETA